MLFSVIMPVYNPPLEGLRRAIRSVQLQTYEAWQLVLVDDGSTGSDVRRLLKESSANDARILLIEQANRGASAARNTGVRHAAGDYVMYLDSDDELAPGVLKSGFDHLSDHEVDLLLGYVQYLTDETRKSAYCSGRARELSSRDIERFHADVLGGRPWRLHDGMPHITLKNGPVARFVRTSIALEVLFPEGVAVSEDTLWNLRLLERVESVHLREEVWYWYWTSHESTSRGYRPASSAEALSFMKELANARDAAPFSYSSADVASRVMGEINRAVRLCYRHPACRLGVLEKAIAVRSLMSEARRLCGVGVKSAGAAGLRPTVKYVLFTTGLFLVVPLNVLQGSAGSGTSASMN